MKHSLHVTIGMHSDQGQKPSNQDFHEARLPPEPLLTTKGIAIALADGISSSDVSHIASQVAITSFLSDYFSTPESWSVHKSVSRVLSATNTWLYSQTRQSQYRYDRDKGYVCTFSGLVLRATTAHLFHIGDARIYRLRGEQLECLTEAHRLYVSQEQSYLSRAMGMDSHLSVDYASFPLQKGDLFFLLTDGVYEYLDAQTYTTAVTHYSHDLQALAQHLVQLALEQGSPDNLTAQVLRVETLPEKGIDEIHRLTDKPAPPPLEARMECDGYRIIRPLSTTSRSHVYLAVDLHRGTSVVLKTPSMDLQHDPAYLERFVMEEWIARRINNAHLLKAYEQHRERQYLYTVFEYIEGETLTQWMHDHPRPSLALVRGIADQIGRGLEAMHRLEMIHQDLRPENILIDVTGTVRIIDFGATRIHGIRDINTTQDETGLLGTLQYSAPEYFLGEVGTARSDIYALGVILYHMLSGNLPYGAHVARATTKQAQKKLRYPPLATDEYKLPLWVDMALKKALDPDPHKRYSVVSELLYDLHHPNRAFLNHTPPPLMERNPLLFWQLLSATLVLALVVVLMWCE